MGMNIKNRNILPILVKRGNEVCSRCGHRAIYHVTETGGLMSLFAAQVKLVACFIVGCVACAQYKGES